VTPGEGHQGSDPARPVVPAGFKLIGAYKLVSAALALILAFGLMRLFHGDVAVGLEALIRGLRLDPENRLIHAVVERLARIDHLRLELIEAGTFAYAILHVVEGIAILKGRRWGAILIILATSSLIPLECYEVLQRRSLVRIAALVVNAAIVVYLIRNRGRLNRGFHSGRWNRGGSPPETSG
jgi:uncharacterized membrane protein (DUF2068 family)